jgi:hypothetical protein
LDSIVTTEPIDAAKGALTTTGTHPPRPATTSMPGSTLSAGATPAPNATGQV